MAAAGARASLQARGEIHNAGNAGHAGEGRHARLGAGAAVVTSLAAGAVAGALAKTTIAPLDRAKINFQTSRTPYSFRAALRFLSGCVRAEGVAALWRGNSATMARIVPYAAIQFTAHEQWKRVLGVDTPLKAKQNKLTHLVAGSLAGVTSQSATYPLDLARARMAVTSRAQYSSLRAVFVRVVADEGFRTLYRGYGATVLGVVPYAGVSFFTYDTLKHKYLEKFGKQQSAWMNVVFGGAAGALGQTASYPLDIVRRRMQTAPPGRYTTIAGTLATVYREEGWRGFFKGLSMNWVKGPVAVGISFATYDAIKGALRDLALTLQKQ
ncbi:dephosphocoenzyme A carrier isoform X2 [Choristoneura fumiferana]|uniref:dephosphocoenzyme A carrier isoform X2 n=1 Tax=Choristoneura fumiferana TaxID=7141 RepID=UPI003D1537A1